MSKEYRFSSAFPHYFIENSEAKLIHRVPQHIHLYILFKALTLTPVSDLFRHNI